MDIELKTTDTNDVNSNNLDTIFFQLDKQNTRITELEILEQQLEYLETDYGKLKMDLSQLYHTCKMLILLTLLLVGALLIHIISVL